MNTPRDLKSTVINSARGWSTYAEEDQQPASMPRRIRNMVPPHPGGIARRRYGTKHRVSSYPTGTMIGGTVLYDPVTNLEHEIVVVLDASNNTRIYVETSGTATATWLEITRKFTAKVNDASIGATDTSVDVDTVTDNGAVIADFTGIDLAGWVVFNISQSVTQRTVTDVTIAATTATVTVDGTGWAVGDHVWLRGFTLPISGGDIVYVDRCFRIQTTPTATSFTVTVTSGWQTNASPGANAKAIVVPSAAIITSNTATSITTANQILGATGGFEWADDDNLVIMRSAALYEVFNGSNGTNVHVDLDTIQEQRKVIFRYAKIESDGSFTRRDSLAITKRDAATYFNGTVTLAAGWYADHGGGGLSPYYKENKTLDESFFDATIYDDTNSPYMRIEASGVVAGTEAIGVYVTLVYGYQESDPVMYKIVTYNSASTPSLIFYAGAGRMNKMLTGIRVYTRYFTVTETTAKAWNTVGTGEYGLYQDITLAAGETIDHYAGTGVPHVWGTSGTEPYFRSTLSVELSHIHAVGVDLATSLGHDIDTNRTFTKGLYHASARDTQGSRIIIDKDGSTLFSSIYGGLGAGVHSDDNISDVNIDVNGFRQKFYLLSKGELMGVGFSDGQAIAFKRNWVEFLDVQGSNIAGDYVFKGDNLVKGDVASRKGIVQTPDGMYWIGHNGVYAKRNGEKFIREIDVQRAGGGEIVGGIRNYINGELLTDDGTQYTTAAYREAAVGGYDPFYGMVLWNIQANITNSTSEYVTLGYHIATDSWWMFTWNTNSGRVRWFSQRKDNTLTIGHNSAILKYPNIESTLPFEELVTSADATASTGYETSITLNLGFLKERPGVVHSIILEFEGEATEHRFLKMKISPEGNTDLIDVYSIPFTTAFGDRPIGLPKIGVVDSMWIQLYLPTGTEYGFKKFEIQRIIVNHKDAQLILA